MAYRKMTQLEISKRIGQGALVVYVDEEYGYRQWYWFPNMSESDLEAYWAECNIEAHFFSPHNLPGDMVPVPGEDWGEGHDDDRVGDIYETEQFNEVSRLMERSRRKGATDEDRQKYMDAYDQMQRDSFPNEQTWYDGARNKNTWRAHTHMEDDSWLKKPGE